MNLAAETTFKELSEKIASLNSNERLETTKSLRDYENEEAVVLLGEKGLKDQVVDLRIEAAKSLLAIGGKDIKKYMLKALKDRSIDVKKIAIEYFETIIDEDICVNISIPLLENKSAIVKAAVIDALRTFKGMSEDVKKMYVSTLKNFLYEQKLMVFVSAVYALTEVDPENSVGCFLERFKKGIFNGYPNNSLYREVSGADPFSDNRLDLACCLDKMVETIMTFANREQLEDALDLACHQIFYDRNSLFGTRCVKMFNS